MNIDEKLTYIIVQQLKNRRDLSEEAPLAIGQRVYDQSEIAKCKENRRATNSGFTAKDKTIISDSDNSSKGDTTTLNKSMADTSTPVKKLA